MIKTFENQLFTENEVYNKFKELLDNPIYKQNIQKI